jgi:hypothetical protein
VTGHRCDKPRQDFPAHNGTHFSPVEIDLEVAGLEGFDSGAAKSPPQGSPETRKELAHSKGFREIVVGGGIEARDFFGFFMPYGHRDNGS